MKSQEAAQEGRGTRKCSPPAQLGTSKRTVRRVRHQTVTIKGQRLALALVLYEFAQ